MQIKYRKRELTMDDKISIVTDYNGGLLVDEILTKHGIGRTTLYRVLRQEMTKEEDENKKLAQN